MDFKLDAFPVDDTKGGIRSTEKIRIIICYVLLNTNHSLSRENMLSALFDNGIANYFEISQAIDNLLEVGAVGEENGNLQLLPKGVKIARELEDELSVYIKSKAVRAATLTAVYEKRKRENDVTVTKINDKKYRLDICLHSGLENDEANDNLLEVSVYVTDSLQAQSMKRVFLNNPVKLYENVITALTDDNEFKE